MGYLDFGKSQRVTSIVEKGVQDGLTLGVVMEKVKNDLKGYGELSLSGNMSELDKELVEHLYEKEKEKRK
ncbi:hypothetical protein ACFLZ4_02410 [Patescibacteria group bacterium]